MTSLKYFTVLREYHCRIEFAKR